MPEDAGVAREDRSYTDAWGIRIHAYLWPAREPRGIVQIAHGVGEHARRYEHVAQALAAAGWTVVADDHRGHGATGLGQHGGDHARLGRLGPGGTHAATEGVRGLTRLVREELPGLPLAILGHSWGSLLAQRIIDRHAGEYEAVVLSGTALRTLRRMNGGDLAKRHRPPGGGTGVEWLSRDPEVAEAFLADPLTLDAKVPQLFGVLEAAKLLGTPRRLARDIPMLIQIGSEDTLGGPRSVELLAAAYRRAGLSEVEVQIYEGARHEVYNETNRAEVIAELADWLDRHLAPAPA
ncbi:alpha/beta fold hydrolase [Homoserinibacter sp. YIM 151385]|uniref:alpha/beta fold hydrolase n=1 Tax=Homoserinibacter sp. YIM 151385 TaxID=2985506 RepID=UPI0022F07BA2|nr:alpha/beta hydrolase [Homoserinibacter sp. YIM 151385]WBU37126.1 alpha/beta hydrolase [Homoserinibacter sp. YIM 151385]